MIDKFFLFLSIDFFAKILFPLSKSNLAIQISQCARMEVLRILKEGSGYYDRDLSRKRINLSKSRFLSDVSALPYLDNVVEYLSCLLDLFDECDDERNLISTALLERIDRLLRLEITNNSDVIYSAIEKLHEEYIFSSNIDTNPIINSFSNSVPTAWALKLQDPTTFDGIEDSTQGFIQDIFESFPAFAFLSLTMTICNDEELKAILAILSNHTNNLETNIKPLFTRITSGLCIEP